MGNKQLGREPGGFWEKVRRPLLPSSSPKAEEAVLHLSYNRFNYHISIRFLIVKFQRLKFSSTFYLR
jgi:hypothetical protein